MPEPLLRCFTHTKARLRGDHDGWSKKRVDRVARAICVKSTGQQFKHNDAALESMFNVSFSESGIVKKLDFRFSTPVEVIEASKLKELRPNYEIRDPDSKIVVGQAILATLSSNFNRYSEKVLKKAVKTIIGKTCQIDHSLSARDTFGRVTDAWWDTGVAPSEMAYIAELEGSDPVTAKVVKGYVDGVSVSGDAGRIECSICGEEWNWMHEHWPGEEYDGKVCERIMYDVVFKHLGFTPIPAFDSADAYYVANSMSEAIDNTTAYMDILNDKNKPKQSQGTLKTYSVLAPTFGETMTSPEEELAKALEKASRLQYQEAELKAKISELEAQATETDDLQKTLDKMRDQEKSRLVNEVIDLEIKLKKVDSSKIEARKNELVESSVAALEANLSVLRDWHSATVKQQPTATGGGPKSKNFGHSGSSKIEEISPEKKAFYIREAKIEQLHLGLFGKRPSVNAVKTLQEWDSLRGRWKTDLSEMFRAVPKRS